MSDAPTLKAIDDGELINLVDEDRPAGGPFKLPSELRTLAKERLEATKARNAAATLVTGATVGATATRQQAIDRTAGLLRNAYRGIGAVPSEDLSDAERAQIYSAYGWNHGLLGDLRSHTRIEALAHLAATTTADPDVPAAGKYPATLASRIANWLAIAEGAHLLSTGGSRQALIQERNDARDLLILAIARVRFFYCSASDDVDQTLELAKIGMQPRRDPGDAQPQPPPEAAGAATSDATTRLLSVPALPAHATFLRAYRQVTGGQPEAAGVFKTPDVSVATYSPLTPGATYELWVVGVNFRGEGPASNKVSFHA